VAAGIVAVLVRSALPLDPQQLPTLPVVVLLAIVTTFVGPRAGISTAIIGGLLSWYLFFNPRSWSLANGAWVPLLGYVVLAIVIVSTAHLYRSAARTSHDREVAALRAEAETAELFAREMAHRLKNALAIVQSLAFQTFPENSKEAPIFAGRLRALAVANELLDEHVKAPSASAAAVIQAALAPFNTLHRIDLSSSSDATLPSQQVVSLALAVHELTTNAIKYGALSNTTGRVSIRVEDDGSSVLFTWTEEGGPAVIQSTSTGFGTRLLRRAGERAALDFQPSGLRCSMGFRKSHRD
jgi:two-component sensor histidine kinase